MVEQRQSRLAALTSAAIAALLPLLAGCGDIVLAPSPRPHIAGSYTLMQVNGSALPSTISSDGPSSVEITQGSVDLGSDSTWLSSTTFRITTPSGVALETQSGSGQWSFNGDSVRFDGTGTVVGAARSDTLWVLRRTGDAEARYVYTR